MLNQTGLVDRHTLPSSLPLPSRSSVPGSRSFAGPLSPSSSDYGGAVPAFESVPSIPYQEDFEVEDPEWFDPYVSDFSPEEFAGARDPILNSALAGQEAEAMIMKYGGDLHRSAEPAPMAATQPASLFCDSVPVDTGMKLPPVFAREFDR